MGTTKPTLGEQVRSAREKAGKSQEILAHELGLADNAYLSRIENDKQAPSLPLLEQMADHLWVEFIIYPRKRPES